MKIGERIKERRKFLGMTVDELAEKLQKNRATIYRYESNDIEKLPTTVLEPLAVALKTTPAYLMGWEDDKPNAEILSAGENIYKIPVFSSVSAGFGAYACSDVIDYMHLYIANPADVPEMLCIKVTGDSMYRKIEDGDIIVVRKQDSVDSGSIAVVLVDGEEGFVKKVIYDNETIELVSINPEYAPKIFKGAEVLRVRVVGIVKQVIKTL
jgi:repressor LexA